MFAEMFKLQSLLTLFVVSLLLVGSFGISHAGMSMDMEGTMTDCPFMPGVSICSMSPLEMIAASQSFLSTVTLGQDSALLLLISVALVLSISPNFLAPPKVSIRYRFPKQKQRPLFNFLVEAFSNGILNPKLF